MIRFINLTHVNGKLYTENIKEKIMGIFKRRGFRIIRFIGFTIILAVFLYLLLRGQIQDNIIN